MTLAQLIEELQLRSRFTDSKYRPRWISFINTSVRDFARASPWPGLEDTIRLTTDGTKYLVFPHFVEDVTSLLNVSDNLPIERTSDLDVRSPATWAQGTTGTPWEYDRAGDVCSLADPTGYLWFQSTHASDTMPLYITGIVANSGASGAVASTFAELSISASGTSPVTLTTLFTKLFSISKATETNGNFFLYDAGATSAHRSYLGAHETEARFRRIALHLVPAAGKIIEARIRYRIPKLLNDAQAPHPSVKADYIIHKALAMHLAEQEQFQRSQVVEGTAQRELDREITKEENFNEPSNQMLPFSYRSGEDSGTYDPVWY